MIKILSKYDKNDYKEKFEEEKMDIEEEEINNNNDINYNYNEVSDKYYKEKIEPFIQQNDTMADKTKLLVTKDCGLIVSN